MTERYTAGQLLATTRGVVNSVQRKEMLVVETVCGRGVDGDPCRIVVEFYDEETMRRVATVDPWLDARILAFLQGHSDSAPESRNGTD